MQWCSPVRLEVLGGASLEGRALLGKCFSVIPYRPCREEDWDRAIALAWRLRSEGLTVPWLDLVLYRPGYGGSFNDLDEG